MTGADLKEKKHYIWSAYVGKAPNRFPILFYVENGIIWGKKTSGLDESINHELCQYIVELGYDPWRSLSLYGLRNDAYWRISDELFRLLGHPFSEFESSVKKWAKALERGRNYTTASRTNPFDTLDPIIIGIDRNIDVYSTGFNVRVICSSESTFSERKKYVCKHKKELLKCVIQSIDTIPCLRRHIKDISFFTPVEIVCLRAHEIEIKFSVKGEIHDKC